MTKNHKYTKVFGTKEWASKNFNFINGCIHDCKYCYSKSMAIRFKRKTPQNWKIEEVNHKILQASVKRIEGRIMFPSSHDISPENLNHTIGALRNILKVDNHVLIVTKPHLEVIQRICEEFPDKKANILFRFTIGSTNSDTLKFWEPGAPSFEERLESLKHAHDMGFSTSISSEPVLDSNSNELIETLLPFVSDAIWIGKPNKLKSIMKVNGANDPESAYKADELMKQLNDQWALELYDRYKNNPKVKWKDSMKKVLNLEAPCHIGMDI
jgi:DNA repair photolyase